MDIQFSAHAKARLAERHITEDQAIEALTPPTKITPGKDEKFVATKNGIRVIYAVKEGKITVVTVTNE